MKKAILFLLTLILILIPAFSYAEVSDIVNSNPDYTILGDTRFWFTTERYFENHEPTVDLVFNVSDYFTGVGLPIFWASNPNNGGGQVKARIRMSLYEYDGNYDSSIKAGPICYAEFFSLGDCPVNGNFSYDGPGCRICNFQSGAILDFDKPMKPGQYIFRVEENSNASGSHYLVLPMSESSYDGDKFMYYCYGKLDRKHTLSVSVRFLTEGEFVNLDGKGQMSVITQAPDFEEPTPGEKTSRPAVTSAPSQTDSPESTGSPVSDNEQKSNTPLILSLCSLGISAVFLVFVLLYINKGKKR